jgi:hypothetical protein
VAEAPSRQELEALHCWEAEDAVSGRPQMTAFRRRLRLHQARWRAAHGHPIGSQPIVPRGGKPARLVGSRLPLEYARETAANFVTTAAREAARARASSVEPHQSFDHQRLWADLLWSPTLCFNLFGDLTSDLALADGAVHAWWPDTPGTVTAVRFAHSPGRLDASYLGNLIAFDVVFVLDLGDGTRGIVGVETRYHERAKRALPKPARLPRYREVARRSGAFGAEAIEAVNGTDLLTTWLGHLLVHSMLQRPRDTWRWGRYVVVHPRGNTDLAGVCSRYRSLLKDASTFSVSTLEELLAAPHALPNATVRAVRERYVVS